MGFTVPLVLSVLGEAASGSLNSNLLKGIGALDTALLLIDRTKGLTKAEKHQTMAIVRRMGEAVQAHMEQKGSEADRQAYLGAATSAEIVLEKLLASKEALVQAARCDADVLVAYIYDNGGSAMRLEVDQKAEGLFDELLAIVAAGLTGLAQTSPDFFRHAFLVSLDNQDIFIGGQEALMELVQRHGQDLSMVRKVLEELGDNAPAGSELQAAVSRLSEIVATKMDAAPVLAGQGRRIRFGSPPARAAGFVSRDEQARLNATLGRPEPQGRRGEALKPVCDTDAGRSVDGGGFSSDGDGAGSSDVGVPVVLSGMRGVGKSQLAAAYYLDRVWDGWSLMAWMDASTREQAVAGLAELAVEMGLDDNGKGDLEALARRCVTHLNSGDGDRLLVFDNVEDVDDLTGLMPRSDGLRVLVTTTMSKLDPDAGYLVPVDMFTRDQSVAFILKRTGMGGTEGADRLAEALGDLPVALAQATGTIDMNRYATIDDYLVELGEYPLGNVVGCASGEAYPLLMHVALRKACQSALDLLEKKDLASGQESLPRAKAASVQLAALALLAPSGVPRPWLHRVGESEPIARQALGALVAHSVCAPSEDGRYIRIHSLQGRVLREDYTRQPEAFADLETAVVDLLEGVDMGEETMNDAQRADALDKVDHLRAIAGQAHYSPHETHINPSNIATILTRTLRCLTDMGRPQTALTLEGAVGMLADTLGPDHPDTLVARHSLANAHYAAWNVSTAADMYEAVLTDMTRVLGPDHPDTLATRDNLATAQRTAEGLQTAIDSYEAALTDMTRVLGPDHPPILAISRLLSRLCDQDGGKEENGA